MFNMDSNKLVLCVGFCTLDIIQVCNNFPVEDSDERSLEGYWQRGGNASNNCSVLSQLGVGCEFLGTFSKKTYLKFLIDDFHSFNIKVDNCPYYENADPPLSTVILSKSTNSRTILHSNPNLPDLTAKDFEKINVSNYKWIHFEGRNVREVQKMMDVVVKVNSEVDTGEKVVISVELEKTRPEMEKLIRLADVIFLSKDFAITLNYSNMVDTVKEVKKICKSGAIVICAWGEQGAAACNQKGEILLSPAYPPPLVIDTLGAGDTFCAGVMFGLINNKTLQDSLEIGCKIAGAKIGIKGYRGLDNMYASLK